MPGLFNKQFFAGLAAGIFITMVVLVGGTFLTGYVMYQSFMSDIEDMDFDTAGIELDPPPINSQAQPVDYNWSVQSLDGQVVSFDQFQGKIVFLNIWATWCMPCVIELPTIQSLYEKLQDQVAFLCVSDEDTDDLKNFIKKKSIELPVYTSGDKLPDMFESDGIPATFIIDQNGVMAFKHVGAAKWDHQSVIDFLDNLIQQRGD